MLGNPFTHETKPTLATTIVADRNAAVDEYEKWINTRIEEQDYLVLTELNKLITFGIKYNVIHLVCWCHPERCHGDVIKKIIEPMIKSETFFNI